MYAFTELRVSIIKVNKKRNNTTIWLLFFAKYSEEYIVCNVAFPGEGPYGEAVLILVLFRVLFLVSNEAKECSTPNSTPLVGVLFVVLHSNECCLWCLASSLLEC